MAILKCTSSRALSASLSLPLSSMRVKSSSVYGQLSGCQPCCASSAWLTGLKGLAPRRRTEWPPGPATVMPMKLPRCSTCCSTCSQAATERTPPSSRPLPLACSRSKKCGTSPSSEENSWPQQNIEAALMYILHFQMVHT